GIRIRGQTVHHVRPHRIPASSDFVPWFAHERSRAFRRTSQRHKQPGQHFTVTPRGRAKEFSDREHHRRKQPRKRDRSMESAKAREWTPYRVAREIRLESVQLCMSEQELQALAEALWNIVRWVGISHQRQA